MSIAVAAALAGATPKVGFSPADIDGLALWLDASDESTITESGNAASQIDDLSGNGRHFVQATAARQPTTGTKTLNGLNVLAHDGGDDMLGSTPVLPAGTPLTFIMVWRHVAEDFLLFTTENANRYVGVGQSGSADTGIEAIGGTPTFYKNGATQSFTTRDDVYQAYASQVSIATITSADGFGLDRQLGAMAYPSGDQFRPEADLAEVAIYSRVLSTEERETVEAEFASKWGVTLS